MSTIKIKASQCPLCMRVVIPPRASCPYCGPAAEQSLFIELSNKGKIVTYTTVNIPPDSSQTPLRLILVELEKSALVLCNSHEAESSTLVIGHEVEIAMNEEGHYYVYTT